MRRRFTVAVLRGAIGLCILATAAFVPETGVQGGPGPGANPDLARGGTGPGEPARYDAWISQYGIAGVDGEIHAAVVYQDLLVVGGEFTEAGDHVVSHVAAWNGTAWIALGGGPDGPVHALAVHEGTLYAGGRFTEADGERAVGLAWWNGATWEGVTDGLRATGTGGAVDVRALWSSGDDLYLGGRFSHAGELAVGGLACWDGAALREVSGWPGAGDRGVVHAVSGFRGALVVGGEFSAEVDGAEVSNLALRGADGVWNTADGGVPGAVHVVLAAGDSLVVGGLFERPVGSGVVPARNVASWDGTSWRALGLGVWGEDPAVFALAVHRGVLAVGGRFSTVGDTWASRAASWNGEHWGRLSSGVRGSGHINAFVNYGSLLFAGGRFRTMTSHGAYSAAVWSTVWNPLGRNLGLDEPVFALSSSGFGLLTGGAFSWAGRFAAEHFATWDGEDWLDWDSGFNDAVLAAAEYDGSAYAGGLFRVYTGGNTRHVAAWDGLRWTTPRGGAEGGVRAFLRYGGDLVAGGDFRRAGGRDANYVARWDGVGWHSLGNGLNGPVYALAEDGTSLYVGGFFTQAGEASAARVARWDGEQWHPLGAGFDREVRALCWFEGSLYAGGSFESSGDVPVWRVARWDGSSWVDVGDGFDGPVHGLAVHGGRLVAGGAFGRSGARRTSGLASWNGIRWAPLSGGVGGEEPIVHALASHGGDLYAGGAFTRVGERVSFHLARWAGEVALEVWPGDTNDDGHVDIFDVLPLGRFWNAAGPARGAISADWRPQTVEDWERSGAAFADANGDGTVDSRDLEPIVTNWNLSQSGLAGGSSAPGDGDVVSALRSLWDSLRPVDAEAPIDAGVAELREAVADLLRSLGSPPDAAEAPGQATLARLSVRPRPSRGSVTLSLALNAPVEDVSLSIFDVSGRQVRVFHRPRLDAGAHAFVWNDDRRAAAGVYFARAQLGPRVLYDRIVVVE